MPPRVLDDAAELVPSLREEADGHAGVARLARLQQRERNGRDALDGDVPCEVRQGGGRCT